MFTHLHSCNICVRISSCFIVSFLQAWSLLILKFNCLPRLSLIFIFINLVFNHALALTLAFYLFSTPHWTKNMAINLCNIFFSIIYGLSFDFFILLYLSVLLRSFHFFILLFLTTFFNLFILLTLNVFWENLHFSWKLRFLFILLLLTLFLKRLLQRFLSIFYHIDYVLLVGLLIQLAFKVCDRVRLLLVHLQDRLHPGTKIDDALFNSMHLFR